MQLLRGPYQAFEGLEDSFWEYKGTNGYGIIVERKEGGITVKVEATATKHTVEEFSNKIAAETWLQSKLD